MAEGGEKGGESLHGIERRGVSARLGRQEGQSRVSVSLLLPRVFTGQGCLAPVLVALGLSVSLAKPR